MKKIFFIALLAMLFFGPVFIFGKAFAFSSVRGAWLNGKNSLNVESNAEISALVQVYLTDGTAWKSTAYRFGDSSSWLCVDTADHAQNGLAEESFKINAPAKDGTNSVNFKAYENDDCTNGAPSAITALSASLFVPAQNFVRLNSRACLQFAILLSIFMVAFAASFIISRWTL